MANIPVNQRVVKELLSLQSSSDLSLAVAFEDSDVRRVKALIIGPPDTPYEFGFFEYKVVFPQEYPQKAPAVTAITTNGGLTRFNPNIYSDGKVCLSILGTWHGQPGEEWSAAQGLESILLSIQSLMSSNPYENEPGFEKTKIEDDDARNYAAKIHHETLRISVIKRLEEYLNIDGPVKIETDRETIFGKDDDTEADSLYEPFVDLCKRRFLWYYPSYLIGIEQARSKNKGIVAQGRLFENTAFEHACNQMSGIYDYRGLRDRLVKINEKLNAETERWITEGQRAMRRESPAALSLQNTFKALETRLKKSDSQLHLELVDNNPFVWRLIMFGNPMTNLDGGIFKIRMVINTAYPEQQPRVNVETPLFHHRVSSTGVLCYFPEKPGELSSHIEAITTAINEESPRYDPRAIVNPEAAKLFWGNAEEKKLYNRKLRRSAQDSSDHA